MTPEERAKAIIASTSLMIESAIREAVQQEREACARIAETQQAEDAAEMHHKALMYYRAGCFDVAAAIRKRGEPNANR